MSEVTSTWRSVLEAIPGAQRGEIARPLTADMVVELRESLLPRLAGGPTPEGAQRTDNVLADAIHREAVGRMERQPDRRADAVLDELLVELS